MPKQRSVAIRNGRLIDPGNGIDAETDLFILDGKVEAAGQKPKGFAPDLDIDAAGCVVCPGLVDIGVRLREPGYEHKGSIGTETAAAAKGGITSLCCLPDTDPVIDSAAVAALITRKANQKGKARVHPIGALTEGLNGQLLASMGELKKAGCVALSNAEHPLASALVQRRAMEYATTFDFLLLLRPEEASLRDDGCVHEGAVGARLGLPGIPEAAETVAIALDLALARHTDCRVHFHAISSAGAVRLLRQARDERLPCTSDVPVHQLHLTEMDVDGFDSYCHVIPPLRTLEDRNALRRAVAEGAIQAICSDHQPHDRDAKMAPFPATEPGISGLETLLPLTLRLVGEGVLELSQAIALLTSGPADIMGLPLGRLHPGAEADICIFDPERPWILNADSMLSRGRNTPFIGWEFQGQVTHTLLRGRLAYSLAPASS